MSKKNLKKKNRTKRVKARTKSSTKKTAEKKVTKKKAVKKKITKSPKVKRKAIKKLSVKRSVGKKALSGTVKHKTSSKKIKDLKTPSQKHKAVKIKGSPKTGSQLQKKSPTDKKQKATVKARSKSFMPSLGYREKELKNLLEKEKEEKLILKDMEGRTYCAVENCDYPAIVESYCRIHFFGLFKMIKKRKQILEQDLLTKSYISLVNKYSESVFEYLFKDLSSDKDFKLAVKKFEDEETEDFELEESFSS